MKELAAVTPVVAELAARLAEATATAESAKKSGANLLVVRDQAEAVFATAFATFGSSAQRLAGDDAALLTQAARPLASQNTAPVAPPKGDGVSVSQGDDKRHVDAS